MSESGSVIVTLVVAEEHPFASETTRVYTPAPRPVRSLLVEVNPLGPVQLKLYVVLSPPSTSRLMLPSFTPLQLMLYPPDCAGVTEMILNGSGSVISMLVVAEQPFASVTVRLYVPAYKSFNVLLVEVNPFGPVQL